VPNYRKAALVGGFSDEVAISVSLRLKYVLIKVEGEKNGERGEEVQSY
jgi:hypothetical protein